MGVFTEQELHHKMSKKIAQLTKVIFQLNTRNEDCQLEIEVAAAAHRNEIQNITKDATNKLQIELEKKKSLMKSAEDVETVKEQYQKDKMEAFALFDDYKAVMKRNEIARIEEFQVTTNKMLADMKELKVSFNEKSKSIEETWKNEIVLLKQSHEKEILIVVTSHNDKFNSMLKEQLEVQDTLRENLTNEHEQYIAKLKKEHQQILENELNNLRVNHKMQLNRAIADGIASTDETKQTLVSKMENLLIDLEQLRASEQDLRNERQHHKTWQQEISERKKEVTKLQQEKLQLERQLENVSHFMELKSTAAQESLDEQRQQVTSITIQLNEMHQLNQDKDKELLNSVNFSQSLQDKLALLQQEFAEKSASMEQMVNGKEGELKSCQLKNEKLSRTFEEFKTMAEQKEKEREKENRELQTQITHLQKKLVDSGSTVAAAATREKSLLQEKEAQQLSWEKKIKEQENKHQQILKEMKTTIEERNNAIEKGKIALEGMKTDMEASNKKWQLKEQNLIESNTANINDIKKKFEDNRKELLEKESKLRELLEMEKEKSLKEWSIERENLRKSLLDLTIQSEKELSVAQKESDGNRKELSSIQKNLDKTLNELKESEVKMSNLRKKIQELENKLIQEKAEGRKRNEQSIEKLNKEWSTKLNTSETEHSQKLENERSKASQELEEKLTHLEHRLAKEREIQVNSLEFQCNELKMELKVLQKQTTEQTEDAMNSKQQLIDDNLQKLEQLQLSHRKQQEQMVREEELKRLNLKSAMELEMEKCRIQYEQNLEKTKQLASQELSIALAESNKGFEEEIKLLKMNHMQFIETLKIQAQIQELEKLKENTRAFDDKILKLKETLELEKKKEIQELNTQKSEEIEMLSRKFEEIQDSLDKKRKSHAALELNLEQSTLQYCAKEVELEETKTRMTREAEEGLQKIRLLHQEELDVLLEDHLKETRDLSEEFELTKSRILEQNQRLQQHFDELQARYEARESRTEDIRRISELEREVREKESLVKKTLDDMAYFKRELLNREENYNKMFSRSPTVGVMQVIQSKASVVPQLGPKLDARKSQSSRRIVKPPSPHSTGQVVEDSKGRTNGLPPLPSNNNSHNISRDSEK